MRERVPEISFRFAPSPETGDDEVRVLVDGGDLLDSLGFQGIGIDPLQFFAQPSLRTGGELLVGRCECGVVGCHDLRATVEMAVDMVTWSACGKSLSSFERRRYIEVVEDAAASTDWESPGRRAERLVSSLDFTALREAGYSFQWASSRIGRGKIVLSFDFEGTQRLFDIGWDESDPEDAARNVRRWVAEFDR